MSEIDSTLLIVNANARQGNIEMEGLVERLRKIGPVVAPDCRDAADMRDAIARHAASVGRIVIGGGDGTLNGALPAVLSAGLPLGILPLGTANDFARSLGVAEIDAAIDAIAGGHTRGVDVGTVNGHHFLNAVGIGLGPKINRDLEPRSKSRMGVLAYLLHALRHAGRQRGMRVVLRCDAQTVALRIMQITIGNGIHYGGGMTISRDAQLDDCCLRVLCIRPQSLTSLLTYGPAIRSGDIEDDENLQTFSGRTVSVRTRRRTPVTADGEAVTRTPVECNVLCGALTVYAPDTRG